MDPVLLHHFPEHYVFLTSMFYKLYFCVKLVTDTKNSCTRIEHASVLESYSYLVFLFAQLLLMWYGNQRVMAEALWPDMISLTNCKNPISSSNYKNIPLPPKSRGKWSSNWVSKAMWGCYSWSPFRYATLPTGGSLKPGEDFCVRSIRRGEQWRHQIISDQSGIWMSILLIVFLW